MKKFLTIAASTAVLATIQAQEKTPANILVIVADDLGYADVGAQGKAPDIRTPHLDSLAKNGARCTDGYATNPLCAPSRAALLTGRYQQRFGFEYNPGDAQEAPPNYGLPLSEPTLAERLKKAGYVTLAVGKWHLGYRPELQPTQRGFDGFYGHLDGFHRYMDNDDQLLLGLDGKPLQKVTYTTDMFGQEANTFIREHAKGPWFVYLAFSAVHGRINAPQAYLDKFADIPDKKRRTLVAMMAAIDDNVGEILTTLKDTDQLDKTLVIFISDNGGYPEVNASLNTPLQGHKGDLLEGGIRVPFILQYPGVIPAGAVFTEPVAAIDIVPTALAAAGLPPEKKLDGVNLLPFLKGEASGAPHQQLYWRAKNAQGWAVRQGDWKLLYNQKVKNPKLELFDVRKDAAESVDLATAHPEKVAELKQAWDEWNKSNIDPLWEGRKKKKAEKVSAE